ncbi:MAG: SDR family oxidoreductase, partial [Parvularculaceae bacterium]|nr:SDR family oxidoreductase [Parvularculaceae bacterium]
MYKPILVTGASSGIGEATAILLAQRGFRVFAGARRIERLKPLEGLQGGRITAVAIDVTDTASVERAIRSINDAAGPLFGLVNNAGVSVTGPAEFITEAEWRRQFETNVFGLMTVTRAVIGQMRTQRSGRIVNIGSVAGRIAAPFMSAYAASKHAVEGLSDSLRRELKPFGIRVVVVRPGFIRTEFGEQEQEGLARHLEPNNPYAADVAAFKAWHAKGHPNGPPPSAVADTVADAMTATSPHSRYT